MKYKLDELHALPLFLGMGKDELAALNRHIMLIQSHVKRRHDIVTENTPCTKLIIVVSGSFHYTTTSDDHSYSVSELLHAPFVIQPERIFGLTQRFSATVTASTPCEIMTIEKKMVIKLMESFMTFRINMLNILSTKCQRISREAWHITSDDIEHRIVRFISSRVIHPAGSKKVNIKMNDLAREIGCQRLEVSQALHSLEQKELIRMHRGVIEIPLFQQFMAST